jgi:FAD:protein FMN transferase
VKLFIILLMFLVAIALPPAKPVRQFCVEGFAQGTTYSVTYYAADSAVSRAEIEGILAALDSSLSLYKPYSIINAFNQSATGVAIDKHLRAVVEKSLEVYAATGGTFDITVWPLVNAWGFGVKKIDSIPSKAVLDSIMPCIGSNKLQLRGASLYKKFPCVNIDVNGIAQGYSVDVLAALLEQKSIADYLVEIGGEMRLKGNKQPGDEKMKLGIESPADNPFAAPQIKTVIIPGNGAITTSGSYRKFYESSGKRITHIIDPRTGSSVQNELISVTVFAKDAMSADAYDNALMVMGLKEGLRFAQQQKIEAYFIYRGRQGVMLDTATAGFYGLVRTSASPHFDYAHTSAPLSAGRLRVQGR